MACNYNSSWFYLILFFLLIELASSSSFISYDVLNPDGHSGRTLLQAKKECNISFESLDYSVFTSKCKGPLYPAKSCCSAFREFACPYVTTLNDRTNNCAETMFSYINLYGKYPPGLFANECKDKKEGIECETDSNSSSLPRVKPSLLIPTSSLFFLGLYNFQLL
ncbi:hypothetical protein JCGZ_25791 [Jatropha curcas]|uniref:GPI-anchored protein LLG1-like domain-containing protein n=1 Tax=Jatropha curcas TaxID=180498 RepID=A0A067JX78_JATCU|nr:GPI-anchored protein LLG3 [Jatropha curcas]KDP24134.1 hypothetical protein JCGZ_25791 [Jatropha curcas]